MNQRYKVLHLLEWLELGGGLEKITAEIACGLNREKYDVEVWCINRGGTMVDAVQQKGIPVRILNIASYHNPLNILKLARAFKEAKPDIIHTHLYFASTIGRIAAKIAGVPICINHVHSTYWHYTPRNLFIERLLARMTYKIICVSNNVRDFVIDYEKIDASKAMVIYNGSSSVNNFSRQDVRQAFGVPEGECIITTVGSLYENKGHKVLLKALSLLPEGCKNFKCWIVGEGPQEKELKALAKQLNLDSRIVFWGVRQDVYRILSASDIFVLASIHREGLSISVLEAMASKVPVIASSIGGLPEIIDDQENGLLVKPGDPVALAQALQGLILDPGKRIQYAKEAVKKLEEKFAAKAMIRNIEKLYEECMGQ